MKFPYGISHFDKIITDHYFYVDRTDKIPLLEDAGEQLLFLRPRRFGKSLLLSMLENYYDLVKADQFQKLFGHLKISATPTPKHNQYFVMKWDFSMVTAHSDMNAIMNAIEAALHRHLNSQIQDFAMKYSNLHSFLYPPSVWGNVIKLKNVQGLAVLRGLPVLTLVPSTNSLT